MILKKNLVSSSFFNFFYSIFYISTYQTRCLFLIIIINFFMIYFQSKQLDRRFWKQLRRRRRDAVAAEMTQIPA